jgi:hypothetical protein
MNVTRRSAASLLAALPVVGGAAAKAIAGQMPPPNPSGAYLQGDKASQGTAAPIGPKMQEWQAMRLAMLDPDIKRMLTDAAYAQHRVVTSIDPDIEVLRSLSPMAKITFQRQRNVAKAIRESTEEPIWSWGQRAREYVQKLMWGSNGL